jgi:CelD/BcsL family acetyltransferase involved in cellulose biosynthesis
MLLFLDSMAWSSERGFAYYDFTIGGESFKMTLGAQEFALYEHLEALTLRGRPAVYGERIKRLMGNCEPLRRLVVSVRSVKARVLGSRAGS